MDEVEVGEFESEPDAGGWKHSWYFAEPDRGEFLRHLRRMTGNHFQQFGNLLTPLVDGVRIRGPFVPAEQISNGDSFKLALIDGEGLGHTARGADSVSTKITERFQDVDLIVLVDNAQQPMQAAPLSLLRAVAQSGHGEKLAVAFTHFDQVHGDNLYTARAKREHVASSVNNALAGLRDQLSPRAHEMVQSQVTSRMFFLSDLHRPPSRIDKRFIRELQKLLAAMDESGVQAGDIDLAPIYSLQQFELGLRDAADAFKETWRYTLGIVPSDRKEHWARLKAFSRRLMWGQEEYQHLRPMADLTQQLQSSLSLELERPHSWTRRGQEADEQVVIDRIRQHVFREIHELARSRVVHDPQSSWEGAFLEAGRRSSFRRADTINLIYDSAAPSLSTARTPDEMQFLEEIKRALQAGIEREGGILE